MELSIYESIGGAPAVKATVDLFYSKVWGDPALASWFADIDRDRLKDHQRAFVAAALGGPEAYDGRPLDEAHQGLGVTDAAFDRVVEHLASSLAELGVEPGTIQSIAGALAPLRPAVVS